MTKNRKKKKKPHFYLRFFSVLAEISHGTGTCITKRKETVIAVVF